MTTSTLDLTSIVIRLESLERQNQRLWKQNRWLKRAAAAVAVLIVLLTAAVGLLAVQARQKGKVLETDRLVLRDENGKQRALLGIDKSVLVPEVSKPGLFLYDEDGTARAGLFAAKDGSGLTLFDKKLDGRKQATLMITADGTAVLVFNDQAGKTRAGLIMEKNGRPIFTLQDQNGKAFFSRTQP